LHSAFISSFVLAGGATPSAVLSNSSVYSSLVNSFGGSS